MPAYVCLFSAASGHRSISTGKERDAESGLDYFGARYYGSSMGRWMSPDWADKPEAVPYSDLENPQSAGGPHIPTHHGTGCPIHRGFMR